MFRRAIEIDVATGKTRFPQNSSTLSEKLLRTTQHTLADVSQRVPYGTLITFLMSIMSEDKRPEQILRLRSTVPTPRMIRTLIDEAVRQGPFALHLNGLDNPNLDQQWIESIASLVEYIYDNRAVLLIMSLRSDVPIDRNTALLQTPLMKRLQEIGIATIENWHLGPVSIDDVAHYMHDPADEQVVQQLHMLSGGWPVLVQRLWNDWQGSINSLHPIVMRDGFNEPWYFTDLGRDIVSSTDQFLDHLLGPSSDVLSSNMLGADRYSRLRSLQRFLAIATLEGESFTGPIVANVCGVAWEQGLDEIFTHLCASGILSSTKSETVVTNAGKRTLQRFTFNAPIRYLLRASLEPDDVKQSVTTLASAIKTHYGESSWQRAETLLELWSDADELTLVAEATTLCRQYLATVPVVVHAFAELIDEGADPIAELAYVLALCSLEGANFTGEAIARACELPWDDALEDVFDALVDARILTDDKTYLTVPSPRGPKNLYRYGFTSPTWAQWFTNTCTTDEQIDYAYGLAVALEDTYGDEAWRRGAPIVALWDAAQESGLAHNKQHYFEQRAYIEELRGVAHRAEEWAEEYGAWSAAGEAWLELAISMSGYVGDEEMFSTFDRASTTAGKSKNGLLLANILSQKANRANVRSRFDIAAPAIDAGLAIIDQLPAVGMEDVRGRLFQEQGRIHYYYLHDLDTALDFLDRARIIKEQHSTPDSLATTLHEIGRVHYHRNDLDAALDFYERARVVEEQHSTPDSLATTLHEIGRVHYYLHDLDTALDFLDRARIIKEQHSTPDSLATTLHEIGRVHHARNDLDTALTYLEQARSLKETHGTPESLATTQQFIEFIQQKMDSSEE